MTTDRRLYSMELGRRDHTRWLGSSRYAGGAPLTLPTTNLLAAYDARVGVTNVSGACSAWADQSGNGWHATQGTAASRPTITTADGYASLYFDGTNDSLINTGITAVAGPRTIYAVIKPNTLRGIFDTQTGRLLVGGVSTYRLLDTGFRDSSVAVTTTRQRVTYQRDSSLFSFWRNGVAATPVACGANNAIGGASRIGSDYAGAYVTDSHILALFIYNAARNTAVEDYITQEWGV